MSEMPSCKAGFVPGDLEFMARCLGNGQGERWFAGLMQDPDGLDRMLDDPRLFRALLEMKGCLTVSLPFYFYVLVRHVLRAAGMADEALADYLSGLLCRFASLSRMREPPQCERACDYLFEIWEEAERSGGERRFRLQVHLGDYALFQSGLFPKHLIQRVERRAAPGLAYYEEMGSASYRLAGRTGHAEKLGMGPLLLTLCQAFHTARLALNDLSERVLFLDGEPAVALLLKEAEGE